MIEVSTAFVGTLKEGQADVGGWKLNLDFSEVNYDGAIYFYDFTDWNREDILPAVECAFGGYAAYWKITVTRKGPVAMIDFD